MLERICGAAVPSALSLSFSSGWAQDEVLAPDLEVSIDSHQAQSMCQLSFPHPREAPAAVASFSKLLQITAYLLSYTPQQPLDPCHSCRRLATQQLEALRQHVLLATK